MVGGIVVGTLSKAPLSVSGPAAGLTVIVLSAIQSLPSYEAFLLATVLAGVMQIALGATRSGKLAEFVPSSVITGMLAAIGLILILKQIPHALGYDGDYEGSFNFLQSDGYNTLSAIPHAIRDAILPGAALIALVSVAFLFWWDKAKPKQGPLRLLPGPLVVVVLGVAANAFFQAVAPGFALGTQHLVQVPIASSFAEFTSFFTTPDFSQITNVTVWTVAITLAIVASLESLLSVQAVDALDPKRRITDKDREIFAQGGGNLVSGLIGGLPVTSVIVRSSANVDSGADSKLSAILHGILLLASIALIPAVLNLFPLAALAAILIHTGFKLTKPSLYTQRWKQGMTQFVPFVATVLAILFTDLLTGVVIGLGVGLIFVVGRNLRPVITFTQEGADCLVRARRNLYFLHKPELKRTLAKVPDNASVLIDLSSTDYVDLDNLEVINDFIERAGRRGIKVAVRGDLAQRSASQLNAPAREVRFA